MVHALSEVRRALRRGGWLIDLRPTKRNRRIELDLGARCLVVGEIDASATAPERDAADAVLRKAIAANEWRERHEETFFVVTDMDSADDLREFAQGCRRSHLPDDVLPRLESLTVGADDCLIRIHRQMQIALYQRL